MYLPKKPCITAVPCAHKSQATYKCCYLERSTIQQFFKKFYTHKEKIQQDQFALMYIREGKGFDRNNKHDRNSIRYFVPTFQRELQVCSKTFSAILQVDIQRFQRLNRSFRATSHSPEEKRGGDHRSKHFDGRRRAIIEFINSLKGCETHYGREKSRRVYLSSTLNVKKLWRLFTENSGIQV